MSLRSKIVLVLLAVVLVYLGADNGMHRLLATRVFGRWEEQEAQEGLARALSAYRSEEEALGVKGRMWAARSEVRALLEDPARGLPTDVLAQTQVDLFYVCDADGLVLWRHAVDPRTGEPLGLPKDLPSEQLSPSHPLMNVEAGQLQRIGLMMTELHPLVVSSTPIPDAQGRIFEPTQGRFERPRNGFVVLGRFVERGFSERAKRSAGVDLRIRSSTEPILNAEGDDLVARLTAQESEWESLVDSDGMLCLYSTIPDMRSLRPLLFEARMERRITGYGSRIVNYALVSSVTSLVLFVLVLLLLLQRLVLKPLGTLTRKALEIAKTDDSTIRVDMQRADEIGTLASEFDSMLDQIAHSREQLVKTARLAGRSEIATGVLHNVGNVLNSVNVSANLLRRGVEQLSTADLERLVGVLNEKGEDLPRFIAEDPRGKHTLPFLTELTEAVVREKQSIQTEVATVLEGIDHISDLVRSQQTYAGTKGVFELASLANEVDAAMRICGQADVALGDLEVVREYDELPSVSVDKQKLMEVLVNLIQNAAQAMGDSSTRRLTLRVLRSDSGQARIEVQDTGMGIPAENLAKVFHHGFTTKEDGHGFGLHTSSNAATEMNATLQVRSDGPGLGATFFLEIPMTSEPLVAAA